MKKQLTALALILALAFTGCASVKTEQRDIAPDGSERAVR